MALLSTSTVLNSTEKGKKRYPASIMRRPTSSSDPPFPSSSSSSTLIKKPKRAETRQCPVCNEYIPLRLIPTHTELEMARVEEVVASIGSTEVLLDQRHDEGFKGIPSRRSAIKARKSLTALAAPRSIDALDSAVLVFRAIRSIEYRRRRRHTRLREITKDDSDDDDDGTSEGRGDQNVCPVCLQTVRGDEDVVEAHVDACLAFESERIEREKERERDDFVDVENEGDVVERVTDETSFRGTDFYIRDRNAQDVEDEVDIDGNDEIVFGGVQFTENDVMHLSSEPPIEGDEIGDCRPTPDTAADGQSLKQSSPHKDIQTSGTDVASSLQSLDNTISTSRKMGRTTSLIKALENKVKQLESLRAAALVCRICLDPYTEPTASTGCWHTCCRECWLRCLGSTKLCPICKRITAASELRRIYL